jgi:hypothetical protein
MKLERRVCPCGAQRAVAKELNFLMKEMGELGPVAHTCNPSYSGGRDLEDLGLKPAQANSS